MNTAESDWSAWGEAVEAASHHGPEAIRKALISLATPIRRHLVSEKILESEWKPLGIEITEAKIPMSGGSTTAGGRRRVLVSEVEADRLLRVQRRRRRFTVAHEVGHMLLAKASTGIGCDLSNKIEEKFCNDFANHLLIPRYEIRKLIQDSDPPSPSDVLRLADRLDVALHPMLLAVNETCGEREGFLFLLATRRGHPHRPEVIEFRIDLGTDGHFFLPREQRLSSIGLRRLVIWADRPDSKTSETGKDEEVHLEVRRKEGHPRTGVASGPATWDALLLRSEMGALLARIQTSELRIVWRDGKAGKAKKDG